MWSGERLTQIQTTARPDQIMYSLKYGPTLGTPLRIEKNKNGKNEKPKLDDARRLRGIYFLIQMTVNTKKPLKMREETWTGLLTQPCRAKKRLRQQQETGCGGDCISQGSKDHLWLFSGNTRIHKATRGTFST